MAVEGDIDLLNDETFGDGAVEYDWEASHFSKVAVSESHDQSLPLDHDDVIIKAMPVQQHNEQEQLLPKLNELKIKELWPSSPQQEASMLDSIWSSPELPVKPKKQIMQARGSPSLPPGSKAVTLEELEREYLTPSPSTNSASQSTNHTPPPGIGPPPGITTANTPPPGPSHLMGPRPPPMGQIPPMGIPRPHPMMGGWAMPPHGRYPLPPGYPPPRGPLPNIPIRPRQGALPHPFPPHGRPPTHHSHRQQPPHPHHSHFSPPHHHHGSHHHHPHHMQHWSRDPPEAPRKSRRSEYLNEMKPDGSGFMTQKEKEWVIRIQLLQLQSPDPSNDDYYYQNFMKRKLLLEEQKRNHPQTSQDSTHDHSSSPTSSSDTSENQPQLLTLPQIERKERNYRPIEFQGTLGKVAPSSISAPRKTIDVPLSGGSGGGVEGAKDTYTKKKQTLAVIEKLYLLALELEGMEQTVLSLPEEERVELLTKRDRICQDMFSLLKLKTLDKQWTRNDDVIIQLMMGYRKGKRVMKRILPMLSDEHAHVVLLALVRNLSTITKKDSTDQVMPELVQCVLAVVAGLDLPLVNLSLSSLLTSTTSTSASSSAVIRVMQGEFGASLVLGLVRRGQKLAESSQDPPNRAYEEWVTLTKDLSMELHPNQPLFNQSTSSKTAAAVLATLASLPHLQQ